MVAYEEVTRHMGITQKYCHWNPKTNRDIMPFKKNTLCNIAIEKYSLYLYSDLQSVRFFG